MGRLKKDHSGYHTSGLYLKYQSPKVDERPQKKNSKKDTNKWCRGKVGREHNWHTYQQKRWDDERWSFMRTYIEIKCAECRKEKYIKTAKGTVYPIHAYVHYEREVAQIQVRVNGKIIPFDTPRYNGQWWCDQCRCFHSY